MTFKFTPEQEAWLQTLERDDMQDKQTTGQLRSADGKMCCLGVLCSIQPDISVSPSRHIFVQLDPETGINWGLHLILTGELAGRVHLRSSKGWFAEKYTKGDTDFYALTELNDSRQFTFKEIAAYIRSNPENVFVKGAE